MQQIQKCIELLINGGLDNIWSLSLKDERCETFTEFSILLCVSAVVKCDPDQ